jgi:outer membrane protein
MTRSRRSGRVAALANAAMILSCGVTLAADQHVYARPSATAHGTTAIEQALALAYENNPQLNAQRAIVRSTDEVVPQALSGYRPRISATADVSAQYSRTLSATASGGRILTEASVTPRGYGITGTQTVYNGLQTANRTRLAEGQVSAAREALRLMEQTILLDAATAYMNVLRDSAIRDLQRRNVEVLEEQLRAARNRLAVGEITRTDVAQAESRLEAGRSALLSADANYTTSRAAFRRVIGVEAAAALRPGTPVDRFSPRTLARAVALGRDEHPSVTAAMYGIDVAHLQVKINEGALYPTVTVQGTFSHRFGTSPTTVETLQASAVTQLTAPIYQGGQEYALIRQSKETLAQRRLDLDTTRDQIRATVVQSWGLLEAAKAQIEATQAQVTAAEIAVNGVREEARVGQRTTLDVLNAQQELVNARVSLVVAQRDRVVASYTLLAAVGRLSADVLRLPVSIYDPVVHYHQVRDAWLGVRTPDGR